MGNIVRDLIEISGIADTFPSCPRAFTEMSVMENLKIPDHKPEAEQILKVIAEVNVLSKRIVETPIGKSSSGLISTGVKLVVELNIREKIVYIANEPSQPVHAFENEKVVSSYIVIPKISLQLTPGLSDIIAVEAFIEDIFVKLTDKRDIFKNITIFLNASSSLFN
ncbi:MAG: DUF3794 domain-containing protein [Clostridiales bacterium]|jgi:hypothetical protein|nr:DUF3794 domain-containing protein [Eubacteriales bacterium]MDH7567888.1 DUF3794 domain-containing protein [Clostridiales bacterium]